MSRVFNEKKRFPRWFPTGMFLSLFVAFKNLFRPAITVRYPHVRSHIPERARWAVEIAYAKDGTHRCTACRICEKECPNFLIDLDIETAEDRSKLIKRWYYRRGGCMMCGLCVEACPFDAIKMGHDYELAHASPDLLEYELLSNSPAYKKPRPVRSAVKAVSGTVSDVTATAQTTDQKEADNA
jgi:NADH-quinone oxidoreductase subunit I